MSTKLVSFGEAMIRFMPTERLAEPMPPSAAQSFLSTIGGDEMNVCLDLQLLGVETEWVSVLPTNQWGQIIKRIAEQAGVATPHMRMVDGGEVGIFFVIPEQRTVEFQRRHSAFALQALDSRLHNWAEIYDGAGWLHATGITPAISPGARCMWKAALDEASANGMPISFDLNHRPQLGPLDTLWADVRPYLVHFHVIILSVGQIVGLAGLEGYVGELPAALEGSDDEPWRAAMRWFHQKWSGPAVSCCFKVRREDNVQRRWSVLVNDAGEYSTRDAPVWHVPKEETGGGSAWAAGFLFGLLQAGGGLSYADARSVDLSSAIRSGDVLSSMCQESVGDHSTVLRPEFEETMTEFPIGNEAYVGVTRSQILVGASKL